MITQLLKFESLNRSKQTARRDALSYADRQDALSRYSILWPRLGTAAFTVILLACVFVIGWRVAGLLAGTLAAALLIAAPGFLELSSSCMLEIPALAMAVTGLCVLLVGRPSKWCVAEILSGILFGLAVLIKLVPLYLLPLAALILWLRHGETRAPLTPSLSPSDSLRCRAVAAGGERVSNGRVRGSPVYSLSSAVLTSFRGLLVPLLVLGATLLGTFILIDGLIERGAYLVHFQQSWSSHFGGV